MFEYFFLSIETAYRLNESDPNTMLPKIPCHPIGYGVAKTLMRYGVDHMYVTCTHDLINVTYMYIVYFYNLLVLYLYFFTWYTCILKKSKKAQPSPIFPK